MGKNNSKENIEVSMIGAEFPKISVVMAVYNGEPYIKETVLSVLNQTFADFEFIIVNDCSTDDTANVVASFRDPRIVLINNEVNMGSSRAGNVGIKNARAKYIARIDADDLCDSERFQTQFDYLENHSDIAILGSSYQIIGEHSLKSLVTDPEEIAIKLFLGQNCIAHSAVMMRKKIFDTHHFQYNDNNPVSQDYELWADVSNQLKIANLKQPLIQYRVHDNQISNKRFKEQQTHAIRIVTNQLRKFIPNVVSTEINAHLALTGFQSITSIRFMQIIDWVKKIKLLNQTHKRFDVPLFDLYIDELYFKRKRDYFNKVYFLSKRCTPKLAAAYLKESKAYQYKADTLNLSKFMAKCLLFQKSK
jgi:glycosyltransferase involved in cell wall biosynthesis